ncbi:MAG: DNA-3-methyladenine glycosylase [Actinobacteria bacterium]|nr:DNA-3-methyladenine glycosylase [Actinomycetota bacterium]
MSCSAACWLGHVPRQPPLRGRPGYAPRDDRRRAADDLPRLREVRPGRQDLCARTARRGRARTRRPHTGLRRGDQRRHRRLAHRARHHRGDGIDAGRRVAPSRRRARARATCRRSRRAGSLRCRRPRPSRSPPPRLHDPRRSAATLLNLTRDFFARDVHEVAPELIGAELFVDGVGGTIVELEAYDHEDPAAHGFRGRTERNASMFGPPGHAYVYRSYGIHWCLNFVCEDEGVASAVLIRALVPTQGLEEMRARRGVGEPRLLCAGPGRLCQALGVTRTHDGLPLDEPPFELRARSGPAEIVTGPRIGITKAADLPWRYGLAGSRFLSRRF